MRLYKTNITPEEIKTVFFMGNSLLYRNGDTLGGRRISTKIYETLIATKKFNVQDYSVGGMTTTTMISDFPTTLEPYLKSGDIVIFWEWINDLGSGGQDPAGAFANGQTYSALCREKGAIVIVCTSTPNSVAGTETENSAVNDLILADNNTSWDYTVNMRITNFETVADCTNLTYYLADEIHHTTAGSDLLTAPIITALSPLLPNL